jgi:hypothetical protein
MDKNLSLELIDHEIQLADALRRLAEIKETAKGINQEVKHLRECIAGVVADIESGQLRLPDERKS